MQTASEGVRSGHLRTTGDEDLSAAQDATNAVRKVKKASAGDGRLESRRKKRDGQDAARLASVFPTGRRTFRGGLAQGSLSGQKRNTVPLPLASRASGR